MRTLILAGLLTLAFAGVSYGQSCIPRQQVADLLKEKHHEAMTASGVTSNGFRVELYESKDGSTWTVIAVRGDGCSVPILDGVSWEPVDRPFPPASPSTTEPSLP